MALVAWVWLGVMDESGVLTVLIADGSAVLRDALREVVEAKPDLCVVGVAGTAEETVALAQRHRPSVVVLDGYLSGGGVYAAQQVHRGVPGVQLVVFSVLEETPERSWFERLGITEYLVKGVPNEEIVAAIRRAAGAGA